MTTGDHDADTEIRFPPRDQLPPGVIIEIIPDLGTTWYERDRSYRRRRTE